MVAGSVELGHSPGTQLSHVSLHSDQPAAPLPGEALEPVPRITALRAPFAICSGGLAFSSLLSTVSLPFCPLHIHSLPREYLTSGLGYNSRKLSN